MKALQRTLFALALLWPLSLHAGPRAFPKLSVSDSFSIHVHFTRPAPGELELIAKAGFRWVRMDFVWELVESKLGVYDFSDYDQFVEKLEKNGLKAYFILDYANPLYDKGLSPHSDEARRAFARFSVAAAQRFAGKGFIWEVWNEPNFGPFWFPKPNVKDYALLALEVGQAFQKAGLDEILVGPATSHLPIGFLKHCFKAGLLEYWSAVTVHPYRKWRHPETVSKDYRRLRKVMKKYIPEGREIPILSGEWGYSTAQFAIDQEKQAKYLPRMFLYNLSAGVPLSNWYDWKDDGPDPNEKEHHFGIVYSDLRTKPTYLAAQTLMHNLAGFHFEKRLAVGSGRDYVLQFRKGEEVRLVVWSSSPKPRTLVLKDISGDYSVIDYLGKDLGTRSAKPSGLQIGLVDSPRYLIPSAASGSSGLN